MRPACLHAKAYFYCSIDLHLGGCRGEIEFQNKMVIELDEDSDRGVTRAGVLFNRIFEVAKQEVGLLLMQNRMKYQNCLTNSIRFRLMTG